MADKTITKCPKCGAEIVDGENELCIQQKFSTILNGTMNSKGSTTFDDGGYTDIGDMISEDGEPSILGCEKCI